MVKRITSKQIVMESIFIGDREIKVKVAANGKYTTQCRFGKDEQGRAIVKKFTADTLEELQGKVKSFMQDENGKSGEDITYYNACIRFIELKKGMAGTTKDTRLAITKNRFKCLHNKPIKALTKTDIYEAVNAESHLAYNTLKVAMEFFTMVCIEYEAPVMTAKFVKDIKKYARAVTKENKGRNTDWLDLPHAVDIVRWAADNPRPTAERTAISILLDLHSLRSEETRGLQYRDVVKVNGECYLYIRRVRTGSKDHYSECTKTEGSTRKIWIDERLYNMIHSQPHAKETDFVIDISYHKYYEYIKAVTTANGYEWITPHKLRHIFISDNKDSSVAKSVGGWCATGGVADTIYTHVRQSEKDELMRVYSKKLLDTYEGTEPDRAEVIRSHITVTTYLNKVDTP